MIPVRPDWREDAACRGQGPDLWFAPDRVSEAKAVCATCPVIVDCDQERRSMPTSSRGETDRGIWAGLTDVERRRQERAERAMRRAS